MRIAVIGSGLTGLTAAYALGEHHEVYLYERHHDVGMDAFACDIALKNEKQVRVDVPLRVLSPGYYTHLLRLYEEVGVKVKAEDYSFSFANVTPKLNGSRNATKKAPPTDFEDNTLPTHSTTDPLKMCHTYWSNMNVRMFGTSTPLPRVSNILACKLSVAFARFLWWTKQDLGQSQFRKMRFDTWLHYRGFDSDVIQRLIYPIMSVILTCDDHELAGYPAGIVLDYMATGQGESVLRAVGGTRAVCERLTSRCARVYLNAHVVSVHPVFLDESCTQTKYVQIMHKDGKIEQYDKVIIATQANQARQLLSEAPKQLGNALNCFQYTNTHIVCHTDSSVMPPDRKEWRVINFGVAESCNGSTLDTQRSMATIHMNSIVPELHGEQDIFQTLNPLIKPRPDTILSECWADRPVFSPSCVDAFETIKQYQGYGGIYVCGSYSAYGMPLLENAVATAADVCKSLGTVPEFLREQELDTLDVSVCSPRSCETDQKSSMQHTQLIHVIPSRMFSMGIHWLVQLHDAFVGPKRSIPLLWTFALITFFVIIMSVWTCFVQLYPM